MHDEWRRVFPDPSRAPEAQTSAGVAGGDLQPDAVKWTWSEKIPDGPRDVVMVYQIRIGDGLKEVTLYHENCERFPLLEGDYVKNGRM